MEKLNQYLQQLLSKRGQALHLEPNKQPYVVTSNGKANVSNAPLPGAQINTMIFALIPSHVKQNLPNKSEVEFTHPHRLGKFNFLVKKSRAGFNVTITPISSKPAASRNHEEEAAIETNGGNRQTPASSTPLEVPPITQNVQNGNAENDLVIEINSPPPVKNEFLKEESIENEILSTSEYERDSLNKDSAGQKPTPKNILNQQLNSPQSPEIVVEHSVSAQDNFVQEQNVNKTPNNASPNNYSSSLENNTNMQNNYKTQASARNNNVPVKIAPEQVIEQFQPQSQQAPVAQVPVQQQPEPAKTSAQIVAPNPQAKAKMDALFQKMNEAGASDLHMSVSVPPMIRMDGRMAKLDPSQAALTPNSIKALLQSIMPQKNIEEFAERNDTDFAYEIKGLARFRANIFMDRKGMGGVFRIIPSEIMTAKDLNLSKHIMELCDLSKGLVVVTGPTGSGKSTTLCAMVDSINKNREDHIITIEDPIEFTHENQKCLVNQREVHNHTDSFKDALRAALREDPDILLVGEMRDLETISIAIETAETGHLVFGTLHTTTAASTIDRIIDQFPADRQEQIRVMLSESLRGVIAQTLLPKIGGGRVAALEVLLVTPAISNLIREGKTFQIPSAMQTGKNKGMVMLNDALMELVNKGLVTAKDAYIKAVDKEGFEMLLKRHGKRI